MEFYYYIFFRDYFLVKFGFFISVVNIVTLAFQWLCKVRCVRRTSLIFNPTDTLSRGEIRDYQQRLSYPSCYRRDWRSTRKRKDSWKLSQRQLKLSPSRELVGMHIITCTESLSFSYSIYCLVNCQSPCRFCLKLS